MKYKLQRHQFRRNNRNLYRKLFNNSKMSEKNRDNAFIVVIGGGIAGVSCVEQLAFLSPEEQVILITASPLIKAVTNVRNLTRGLQEFDVEERTLDHYSREHPNVRIVNDTVSSLNCGKHELCTSKGDVYLYKKLCICSGASPKIIVKNNPFVLGIRDTETVKEFQKKIKDARRVVVVGNGGIAIELVYEIENCQVIWVIKDKSIGATFFDPGAAEFFIPALKAEKSTKKRYLKRLKYTTNTVTDTPHCSKSGEFGGALGPDWAGGVNMKGSTDTSHDVHVQYECEIAAILTSDEFNQLRVEESKVFTRKIEELDRVENWSVYVRLTNGNIYGCDFVVSATGVVPNSHTLETDVEFTVEDGGLKVNEYMQTSVPDIYAAGDVCMAGWDIAQHWFQMKLWTQARQMGAYAGRCIAAHLSGEKIFMDFCFEMFAHITRFFGYKVVLLGLYNGQKLGNDYEILLRMTKGEEYVKVILKNGKMQGAILIGETDLEETFENLILNQMDLSAYGEDLLNPGIDIEDYFD